VFSLLLEVNISLFIFNLIPIPPLDGSRILREFLPYRQAVSYSKLDAYGPFILLFLFIIPQFNDLFRALIDWVLTLL
jgi:Zn-dependent protease